MTGQVFAILPAAGHSVRMGRPKLLLPLGEKTIIEHVLATWIASRVHRVVIVVRRTDRALAEICQQFPVDLVEPAIDPEDMKGSIAQGVIHIESAYHPPPDSAWMVAPADMPRLTTPLIDQLIAAYAEQPGQVLIPVCGERKGHPVIAPWSCAKGVVSLAPHQVLRDLFSAQSCRSLLVQESAILEDLDSLSDYHRLLERTS